MNRIIIEQNDMTFSNENVQIAYISDDVVLHIQGEVSLFVQSIAQNIHITLVLEENSILHIEFMIHMQNYKTNIHIQNQKNSALEFSYACTYKGENELIVDSQMAASQIKNNIKIRAVENNGDMVIKATGIIEKDTYDNCYLEDIKVMTEENKHIKIMPDLIVKTNHVVANHNATISPVAKEDMFYLKSKGLSEESAISLLKEGFLNEILKLEL